jgi:hypothetical protein
VCPLVCPTHLPLLQADTPPLFQPLFRDVKCSAFFGRFLTVKPLLSRMLWVRDPSGVALVFQHSPSFNPLIAR